MQLKNVHLKVKVEVGLKFKITLGRVCPYFTKIWVQTTQHCLECVLHIMHRPLPIVSQEDDVRYRKDHLQPAPVWYEVS